MEDAELTNKSSEEARPEEQKKGAAAVARKIEPLRLPKGAMIALRKSGGADYEPREVVVYPDGRIAYTTRPIPRARYTELPRTLNDAQIAHLRHLLDQTGFWRTGSGERTTPDAFTYELVARVGQRSNAIEVFDGGIPERLAPLLAEVSKLLPSDEEMG